MTPVGIITLRPDGGVELEKDGAAYGPVFSSSSDPFYSWTEILAYISAHPDRVVVAPKPNDVPLDWVKAGLLSEAETQLTAMLKKGFVYNNQNYQADPGAQSAANGILTAIAVGMPVAFPLEWRSGDNTMTPFADTASFAAFAGTLLGFVQGCYKATWTKKDAIRAATSAEVARAVLN